MTSIWSLVGIILALNASKIALLIMRNGRLIDDVSFDKLWKIFKYSHYATWIAVGLSLFFVL